MEVKPEVRLLIVVGVLFLLVGVIDPLALWAVLNVDPIYGLGISLQAVYVFWGFVLLLVATVYVFKWLTTNEPKKPDPPRRELWRQF